MGCGGTQNRNVAPAIVKVESNIFGFPFLVHRHVSVSSYPGLVNSKNKKITCICRQSPISLGLLLLSVHRLVRNCLSAQLEVIEIRTQYTISPLTNKNLLRHHPVISINFFLHIST